jgi:hypothetical protein
MILHKLLVHDKHMVARCDFWLYGRLAVQSPMTNICQVSKTMRDEAYQIFYSTNTFRFSSPCYLTSVLKAPQIQSTLSYVVLHIGKDATENGKCFSQLQKCENLKSLRITLDWKLHTGEHSGISWNTAISRTTAKTASFRCDYPFLSSLATRLSRRICTYYAESI